MSDITLRNVKGTPLTNQEVDDNFSNLNADKYQAGDSATFSDVTLTGMVGSVSWNSVDGTLDVPLNADVALQVGQEFVFYAKATEAIANGDVVMFDGAQGDHVLIKKCDMASVGFDPTYIVGVATQAFANNEFGYVTSIGKVRGLNTSAYAEGTILYVSPTVAGALTPTNPSGTGHVVQAAAVLRSHATQGVILVRLTHISELGELDGVAITNVSTGQYLTYNGSSWVNTTLDTTNWDTAYGWGDHAAVGYLTSFTETDPTVPAHVKSITTTEKANWDTAYGWGNHASVGYLTSASLTGYATQTYVNTAVSNLVDSAPATLDTLNELAAALGDDPNFATTVSNSIGTKWTQDNTKISNWDTAYGWGNHASAGYVVGNTSNAINLTITGVMQANNGYKIGTTTVIDSSRNLTNIGTISSGAITSSGTVKAYGNSDTIAALEIYSDSTHGMRILHRGTDGDFSFERRVNGTNTEFLRIGRGNGNATFAGTISSGDITSTGGVTINSSNAAAKYLRINKGTGDGGILWLLSNGLKFQNVLSGNDLNWYSYETATTSFTMYGSGEFSARAGYQVNGTTVIDASRNHFGAQATFSGKVVMGGDGAIAQIANAVAADTSNTYTLAVGSQSGNKSIIAARDINTSGGGYQINGTTVIDASRNLTNIGTLNGGTPWHSANDGSGSGLDADLLDGQHETAFLKVSLGNAADLNASTYWRAGMFGWYDGTANRPPDNYGQGLSIVSAGSEHNNSNNWITQLAFGTNETTSYFRSKTNAGDWNAWHTIWNSANDGSGSGLDADLLDGQHGSYYAPASSLSGYVPKTGGTFTGILGIDTTSDAQLLLSSSDSWTGIGFNDGAALGAEYIWHNGSNGTFAIGGGGSNVANKKLHVHGGMTIGSGYAATSVTANSLNVEGNITATRFRSANGTIAPLSSSYTFSNVFTSEDSASRVAYFDGNGGNASVWWGNGANAHAALDSSDGLLDVWVNPSNGSWYNIADFSTSGLAITTGGLSVGGNTVWHAGNDGSGSGLDADLLDGLHASSFVQTANNSSLNSDSRNTRGVTRLYRREDNSDFSVQNHWTGTHWLLRGYNGDNFHAECRVGYADSANTLDGIDSASFLRSDADDTFTGNLTTGANNHITFGPNSSWGSSLRIGGNGRTATGTEMASVVTTDGNLHLDAAASNNGIYLNYYAGTNGTLFGNGATATVARMDNAGQLYKSSTTANPYWNASNDGSGSGLDADMVDGKHGAAIIDTIRSVYSSDSLGTYIISKDDGGWAGTKPSGSHNGVGVISLHTHSGNYYTQLHLDTSQNQLWIRSANNSTSYGGFAEIWASNNDGSGSGLDADLLDGQQPSALSVNYANTAGSAGSAAATNMSANRTDGTAYQILWGTSGSTSQLYSCAATTIRSSDGTIFATHYRGSGNVGGTGEASHHPAGIYSNGNNWLYGSIIGNGIAISGVNTLNGGTPWQSSNDGSGSGLDADLLDGVQGTNYFRCDGTYPNTDMNTTVKGYWHVVSNASNLPVGYYGHRWDWDHVNNGQWVFQMYSPTSGPDDLWFRQKRNYAAQTWHKVWTTGNDGSGSGLDADTVDGIQGSSFLRSDASDSASQKISFGANDTNNWDTIATGSANQGCLEVYNSGSGNDAFMAFHVGGDYACYFGLDGGINDIAVGGWSMGANSYRIWHAGNDGSGSGLDADLLDGQHGSYYMPASTTTIAQSNYVSGSGFSTNGPDSVLEYAQWSSQTDTKFAPSTDWYNSIRMGHGDPYSYYSNTMAMKMTGTGSGTLYTQVISNNSAGGWNKYWHTNNDGSGSGLDADLLDGYNSDNFLGKFGNSYYQASTWIQLTGEHGLYAPTVNGAYFYPNNSGSYGTWKIIGARGGYTGIYLNNGGGVVTGMYDSGGNGGDYASGATGGWHYYYHRGNRCMGVGDSTTSSSYGLYEQAGGIYSTGNITAYSDRRVKENIRTIDNALETVEQMRGVYYNRIDDEEKKTVIGFIAQEIDEIEGAKPLVTYAEDVDQYGVSYGNTTALLVEAIKELSQQVKELQQEIKELKNA